MPHLSCYAANSFILGVSFGAAITLHNPAPRKCDFSLTPNVVHRTLAHLPNDRTAHVVRGCVARWAGTTEPVLNYFVHANANRTRTKSLRVVGHESAHRAVAEIFELFLREVRLNFSPRGHTACYCRAGDACEMKSLWCWKPRADLIIYDGVCTT
jgi:hypothetical protein